MKVVANAEKQTLCDRFRAFFLDSLKEKVLLRH